jgi:ligand-binding sensor domain-containing protein
VCLAAASAIAQYRSDALTGSNGLPHNTVAAVVQARDGYLSMTTYDGVVRRGVVRLAIVNYSCPNRSA